MFFFYNAVLFTYQTCLTRYRLANCDLVFDLEKIPFGGLWEPGSPNGATQENCATTFIARFIKRIIVRKFLEKINFFSLRTIDRSFHCILILFGN